MRGIMKRLVVAVGMTVGLATAIAAEKQEAATKGSDAQQAKHFEREITVTVKLDYLLYLPPDYDAGKKAWPLLVFLHGSGERGDDLELSLTPGSPSGAPVAL